MQKPLRSILKTYSNSTNKWDALAITDPHIFGKNPVCRKDDLTIVQFNKLNEIKNVANHYNIPVLCFGDTTNSPNISYGMFVAAGNILNEIKRGYYTLIGQHDLFYHDMESLRSTAMGAMIESYPRVKLMNMFNHDYDWHIDVMNWKDTLVKWGNRIFASHKPVVSRAWVSKFDWLRAVKEEDKFLYVEDLAKDYDIIFCGDWHRRYIFKYKNCTVINPGALTRRAANQDAKDTFPSYVLIKFKPFEYKVVPLKCAKPFDEVISSEHLTLSMYKKAIADEIGEFIKQLPKWSHTDKTKFMDRLERAISDESLEDGVRDVLKQIMHKVYGTKIAYETAPVKTKRFQLRSN